MKKFTTIILSLALTLMIPLFAWAQVNNINISPENVNVGLNFKGEDLTITGEVPDNADAYIKVQSPNDSLLNLSKKGKVGLFWMNVENITVTNVPKLYQIISSESLQKVPANLQKKLGLDNNYSMIYSNAKVNKQVEGDHQPLSKDEAKDYITALVKNYKESGLYKVVNNGVSINNNKFEAKIKLPPNIPQEKCKVTVYFIKDGKLLSSVSKPFNVQTVGVVNWLNTLAVYDGPTYGFIAVMFALAIGSGIAFIFMFIEKRKGTELVHDH